MQRKPSRQGRYRKKLIDPQELLPLSQALEAVFYSLDNKRREGLLSDGEFLCYGLLTLLACRRADAFQRNTTGFRNQSTSIASTRFNLADFWQLLSTQALPLRAYQAQLDHPIPLEHFLENIRFRGIPDSARQALLAWLHHQYPLILVFHIPSATKIFEWQKQGARCISFFKQADELVTHHHDRDAISFIIHDLIHAHEFYANPQRARQQIGFYHWLDTIRDHPCITQLQHESAKFHAAWEYVLSDMNSYGGHLLQTLHAAFTLHSPHGQGALFWQQVVEASNLNPQEKCLFQKINSPEWQDTDFLQLESILEGRCVIRV